MTTRSAPPEAARIVSAPSRRSLVVLAAVILVGFVAFLATGHDISYDTSTADIQDAYDTNQLTSQIGGFAGMIFAAVLWCFGSALRNALRSAQRSWWADLAFIGFAALGATVASWCVTDVALWKAVDYGDESAIRAIATISDAGFLPLMASMIAIYIGVGMAGITTGVLPKWLAIASIVIGVLAPLGPLGFIGFMVLPLWTVAAAAWVRLSPV